MIVFWCKNLFLLPTSSAGKKYIDKTSMLMNQWLQDSPMKNVFKQYAKSFRSCKSKDHLLTLEHRHEVWEKG